jgi:hypothetical protein
MRGVCLYYESGEAVYCLSMLLDGLSLGILVREYRCEIPQ